MKSLHAPALVDLTLAVNDVHARRTALSLTWPASMRGPDAIEPTQWDALFEAVLHRVLHLADGPNGSLPTSRMLAPLLPRQVADECCAALGYLHAVLGDERRAMQAGRQRIADLEVLLDEARRRLDGVVRFERSMGGCEHFTIAGPGSGIQQASCALCR